MFNKGSIKFYFARILLCQQMDNDNYKTNIEKKNSVCVILNLTIQSLVYLVLPLLHFFKSLN